MMRDVRTLEVGRSTLGCKLHKALSNLISFNPPHSSAFDSTIQKNLRLRETKMLA